MIEIIIWVMILVFSLTLLVKGSSWFTDSAEKIGIALNLSPFFIGFTIVALGTSLPELVSSIFAVFRGASEIVLGNVLGSNVANILLVGGIAGILTIKRTIKHNGMTRDILYFLFSIILLTALIWDGNISFIDCIVLISFLIIYIYFCLRNDDGHKDNKSVTLNEIIYLFIGGLGIYFGAKYTIEAVISLSLLLNMAEEIISAGAVALGTSLPEAVVSFVYVKKGDIEIALGNILGSNIFNTLGVVGIAGLFGSLLITDKILYVLLPIVLIATIVFSVMLITKRINKVESFLLLLFYFLFLARLFI
ncbi:MAG: calcium/sodium antiporter [Nanobdellota archaeon]